MSISSVLSYVYTQFFCDPCVVFQPIYIRYDPNPIPGLCGMFPLYLSKHFVSNTRWRVLPVQSPNITRFEQEGIPINVRSYKIILFILEVFEKINFRRFSIHFL